MSAKRKKTVTVKKKVTQSPQSFWDFKFNINTVYWLIIGLVVVSTGMWTYNTNQQINQIYDSIERSDSLDQAAPYENKAVPKDQL